MNELSQHIERLLLTHDCVVVPQFGGFVTMTANATREDAEQLFFPPIRVVRFNPDITEDDGLLINELREQRHCTESEAKRHILHLVLNLRQQLLADGQADFGSIGLFVQDEDGHLSFSPCQAGVITPDFFGLDAFSMPKLSAAQRNAVHLNPHNQAHRHDNTTDSRDGITIRISRRTLKNVIAAAAIILLCALFSTPFDEKQTNEASLLPSESVVHVLQPQTKPQVAPKVEKKVETKAETQVEPQVEPKDEPQVEAPVQAEPEIRYCIVLASNVSQKNADRYVETLKQRGFVSARIYNNGKMNRVVLGNFTTREEAEQMNAELHQTDKEYATSWILAL